MSSPSFLTENAYRVLRLPAAASYSDIWKTVDRTKRAALLGALETQDIDRPTLGPIDRSETALRSAIDRLRNPKQRLTDRVFWFHLSSQVLTDDATKALSRKFSHNPEALAAISHDRALQFLLEAMTRPISDESDTKRWIEGLRAWEQVVADDNYWALISAIEDRGGFEPIALPSEMEMVRSDATRLVANHLVVNLQNLVQEQKAVPVKAILDHLASSSSGWASEASRNVLEPAAARIRRVCSEITDKFADVIREEGKEQQNRRICENALTQFRKDVQIPLQWLCEVASEENLELSDAKQEAAKCLQTIAANFTWADGFERSEELLREARKLTGDSAFGLEIDEKLGQVKKLVSQKKVFGKLEPISSAPSLFSFNGIGFTLYGRSDYDSETRSFVAVYYFIVLFIPIFPIRRYRVIEEGGRRYRFIGKLPLRPFDRIHLWLALAIIAIFSTVQLYEQSTSNTRTSSFIPQSTNTNTFYSAPNEQRSSTRSELTGLKAQIDAGRARHTQLSNQLKGVFKQLDAYRAQIKGLKAEIERLQSLGSPKNVDYYNTRVDLHNEILTKYQQLFELHRNDFEEMQAIEKKDKELVQKYNALVER